MLLHLATAAALALSPAQDPVRVEAGLTSASVPVGGTTALYVTIETTGAAPDEIRVPDLPRGLMIVGTADQSQLQVGAGGRSRITRRELTIVARAPGVYEISSVVVRVGGSAYRTAPLTLEVSGSAPADARSVSRSLLDMTLDADTVFVGEQVLMQAEVTFAEDLRMRQGRPATFEPPAPPGFWVQDLPDPITVSLRVRDGRTVEAQTYSRAYFPLNPGDFRFPPARLHYDVRRGFGYPAEPRELVSDSPRIVVLPLPDGAPAAFTGAVGDLDMDADLAPRRVTAGEAAVLTVTLRGRGNVKALPSLVLPDLDGIDIFPPTQRSDVRVSGYRVGGSKQFQWMLVPQEEGRTVIPPLEYAVFDPELRTYVTLRSDSLVLDVTAPSVVAGADTALRPLRLDRTPSRLGWLYTRWFAAAQALPLLALLLFAISRRRSTAAADPVPHALRQARTRLAALAGGTPDPAWAARVETVLGDVVHTVTGVPPADGPALHTAGFGNVADLLEPLLRDLHQVRFAPRTAASGADLLDRANAVVDALAARAAERPGAHRAAGASGIALLALAALAAPAPAHAQQEYAAALRAAVDGRHAEAANAFAQHVAIHPNDVDAWYNYGIAAARAGDRGRAAWAWLRAARLDPGDADILHNLNAIGAGDAVDAVVPPDRLARPVRFITLALAWWILAGALAAAIAGRRRVAAFTGVPAAAVLLVLGALAVWQSTRPAWVTPLRDGTPLLASPTLREEELGHLEPGAVARIVDTRTDWIRVVAQDGVEGWVPRRAVATP